MPAVNADVLDRAVEAFTLSSFAGRVQELAELAELLERFRLITLTGAPGVGKTRLARELAERHADRVAFVDLAPIGDPALVPRALAAALSVQEVPGHGLMESVVAHLRRPRLLVVLDNCEHLIGACAEIVESLLEGCTGVSILATSRESLALRAERVWPVSPLPVPDRGDAARPEVLLKYAAVRLFVERAGAVQSRFVLNSYVAPAVAEICRRLDGIPLAIELAAARVEMLTPADIARRLDDRFGLLTKTSLGVVPRHQTLLAALDWSYELLSMAEKATLRRLSVFAAGFDLEAAEAVCAGGDVMAGDVQELLAALASKSLVVDAEGASRVRYGLLETIRAYASDRLEEAGEAAGLRERHVRFYLALAEQAEPELAGPHQARWLERLEGERANLRLALEWSLGHGHSERALRLAGALVLFWRVRCHFSEGRELLEAALSASDDAAAPALRAKALWGAGFMALMSGDVDAAIPSLEQSLSIFREHGDLQGSARALLILGNCNQNRAGGSVLPLVEESAALARDVGDRWCLAHALAIAGFENASRDGLPAARPLFAECLDLARQGEDKQGLRIGLIGLGSVALYQGDYGSAETLLEEALDIAWELDEDYTKAEALQYMGWLWLDRGDYARARELLTEARGLIPEPVLKEVGACVTLLARVAHAAGDRAGARLLFDEVLGRLGSGAPVMALLWKADLAIEDGDPGEARRLLDEELARARPAGQRQLTAEALPGLGRLARDAGELRRAAALHSEALELQRQSGAAPAIVGSLEALAGLAGAAGRHHHAARLLGAANTLRQENGYARVPWESARVDADLDHIRRSLSSEELQTALAQGAALSIDEAAAQASNGSGQLAAPAGGWSSLTPAEQRIAALAADGLTNPEIAERLCVTAGTVSNHLSNIFSKLGVRTRTEVAREFWRQEQPAPESQ